ncbi:hypothetical protein ACFQ3Z_43745 [Streptomyces nogalater]
MGAAVPVCGVLPVRRRAVRASRQETSAAAPQIVKPSAYPWPSACSASGAAPPAGEVAGTELTASGPPSAATSAAAAFTCGLSAEWRRSEPNSEPARLRAAAPMTAGPRVNPKSRSRLVEALAMPA